MRLFPVMDLHCDLLTFLQMQRTRTPFDPLSRASHTQMQAGGVCLQTLAIFSYSKEGSVQLAREQIEIYLQLPQCHPEQFTFFTNPHCFEAAAAKSVHIVPAFENASGFCEESESLQIGLSRLHHLHHSLKHILYISLTWDDENRFGGGNACKVGLKEDGKQLLRWMSGKKIAVDFSHTSDALAQDILNFIDLHSLQIPVMASHSNFRMVADFPRNLPDEIAQEIIRRKGVVGVNFFKPFIGMQDSKNILKHLEHGLKLGGESALCFGADFFCDTDFPSIKEKYKTDSMFFHEYGNSSAYPSVLEMFKTHLNLPPSLLHAVASQNFQNFLSRIYKNT